MDKDIEQLNKFDEIIQDFSKSFGLDFFPQEFDSIPAQKMLEIISYHFPVNFSHWSFGRDYELERTKYEYGYGIPYEVVLNSNPSRAYLMNTNPLPVQVMVMSHVYAHNDFMKNNIYFKPTRRDIIASASGAAIRFQEYEKKFGLDKVEQLIDAGSSIEMNVDPDFFITDEDEEQQLERLKNPLAKPEQPGQFADLISGKKRIETCDKGLDKTPLEPERDILLYIQNHSPKPLKDWEKDILSVLRDQSRYFFPQRRTKIMNEGWASYWHTRIMNKLLQSGHLNQEDHGYFNLYNARVLAVNPRVMNPYLVGLKIFEDIEERWNKGQYGKDWEECKDSKIKEEWNLHTNQGLSKIFSIRKSYSDRFFIEHFLTEKLVEDLQLYLYEGHAKGEIIDYEIMTKDWKIIRKMLVAHLGTFGVPIIYVEDGDYKGRRELYLRHAYDGIELDKEYREKTLENIYYLWGRPVHIESKIEDDRNIVYVFDGSSHLTRSTFENNTGIKIKF